MQKLWDKKSQKLEPDNEETDATFAEKAGIYAEFGKIICIGLGYFVKSKDDYALKIKKHLTLMLSAFLFTWGLQDSNL